MSVYDILVIIGAIWFLSIVPLTLLSTSDRLESSRFGFLTDVFDNLCSLGFVFSPILMLVGGFAGQSSGSDLSHLGIAVGVVASFICFPIVVMSGMTLFDNPIVERIFNVIPFILLVLFGLFSLCIGIYALMSGTDIAFGISGVTMGIALVLLGAALMKYALTESGDGLIGSALALMGLASVIVGLSLGGYGIYVGVKAESWSLVAATVIIVVYFGYRGVKLMLGGIKMKNDAQ